MFGSDQVDRHVEDLLVIGARLPDAEPERSRAGERRIDGFGDLWGKEPGPRALVPADASVCLTAGRSLRDRWSVPLVPSPEET